MDNDEEILFWDNEPTTYLRRCSVTGEGMNSGWIFEGDHSVVKYERDVLRIIRECAEDYDLRVEGRLDDFLLQAAFDAGICYWTIWEDDLEDGDTYYDADGNEYTHNHER